MSEPEAAPTLRMREMAPRSAVSSVAFSTSAYRNVEVRWRELARTAERTIALADFGRKRSRDRGPCEVPIRHSDPLMREWVVVCAAQEFAALPGCGRAPR